MNGGGDPILTGAADPRAAWGRVAVAAVAVLVYANALANGFVLDDNGVITRNALVHSLSGVWRGIAHPYWPPPSPGGQYRPLAIASFAIQWALGRGSPILFHVVNVAWHALTSVLVWQLLVELLSPVGATLGAVLFAVHPVHVEAVSNGVGQCDLMSAAFVIAALLAHRRGQWRAVPLFAAALASKESGIVFLGLAAANDLILPTDVSPIGAGEAPASRGRGRVGTASCGRLYLAYVGVAVVFAAAMAIVFRHQAIEVSAAVWDGTGPIERVLTMLAVAPEYIRLMVFPFHLRIEYGPRDIMLQHTVTPAVLLGAGLVVAALVVALAARRRAPAVTFGIAWFMIAISPVANVLFPSGVVLAERTLYLPSVGAVMVAGWVGERVIAIRPRVWILAFGAVVVTFAIRTWTRTAFWHDDKRLVIASLIDEPTSYRAHFRAAGVLYGIGDYAGAAREYANARRLYARDVFVDEAGAAAAVALGDYAGAAHLLDSTAMLAPSVYRIQAELARAWFRAGDYEQAIRAARRAYALDRDSIEILTVATLAAQQLGDLEAARAAFSLGLSDHPADTAFRRGFSEMLLAAGDTAASHREAQRADRWRR